MNYSKNVFGQTATAPTEIKVGDKVRINSDYCLKPVNQALALNPGQVYTVKKCHGSRVTLDDPLNALPNTAKTFKKVNLSLVEVLSIEVPTAKADVEVETSSESRVFKFAVNTHVLNKDKNFEALAAKFEDTEGTLEDIKNHVLKGRAICAGLLGGNRRDKDNFIGSQWVLLDIDNSAIKLDENGKKVKDENGHAIKVYDPQLTIGEALEHPFVKAHCSLIYTSPSHTADWHRFRLIFLLPEFVSDVPTYEAIVRLTMDELPCDPACKDAVRMFYGSTTAEFPLYNLEASLPVEWRSRAIEASKRIEEEKADRVRTTSVKRETFRKQVDTSGWNEDALIRDALFTIPSRLPGSGNYQECLHVLMALHSQYGNDAISIAEEWSPSIAGTTWNPAYKIGGFKKEGRTIGSLFYLAKEYGYKFPTLSKELQKIYQDLSIAGLAEEDELRPSIDEGEWAESLSRLKDEETRKTEISKLRIDDEENHPESFYLTGIWKELYGGMLWNTMQNRFPALVTTIMTYLMGTVPLNLKLMSPEGLAKFESPTLYTSVYAPSGKGKGVIYQMVRTTLGTAIGRIDAKRLDEQRFFVEEFKASQKDNYTGSPIQFNPNLINALPLTKHSDITPQALIKVMSAHEAYEKATQGQLAATSQLIAHSEGKDLINKWGLLEAKGSYASSLCGYWSGEASQTERATDNQFYGVDEALLSMQLMMVTDDLIDLLNAEKPTRNRTSTVSGFSARLMSIEVDKHSTNVEPTGRSTINDEEARFSLVARCTDSLVQGIEVMQDILRKQVRVRWTDEALPQWQESKKWIKEMKSMHTSKTWIAYCEKMPANLVRLAFGARLTRLVSDLSSGAKVERVEVEIADVVQGWDLLNLYAYDRLHSEISLDEKRNRDEAIKAESRSLKQHEDTWYLRFSDPGLLKAWVEGEREKGHNTPGKVYQRIRGDARKRMAEKHGIDCMKLIEAVF